MPNVVELVKKAAVEAVEARKPVNVLFGRVTAVSPLKIQVEQKSIYTKKMLILTRTVIDTPLKPGERVLLIRMQEGKKFIVVDRIEEVQS